MRTAVILLLACLVPLVAEEVRLDEFLREGEQDWSFNLVNEPKSKGKGNGSVDVVRDQPEAGSCALHAAVDFTAGGAYAVLTKDVDRMDAQAIRLRYRSTVTGLTYRVVDATGQTHQRKKLALVTDGAWHDLELPLAAIAGSEHWGGAADGVWHGPLASFSLLMPKAAVEGVAGAKADLWISDVRAVLPEAAPAGSLKPWREGFEAEALPEGWRTVGGAAVAAGGYAGARSLRLQRTMQEVQAATGADGAAFPAAPGMWRFSGTCASELYSPDNSFRLALFAVALDEAGAEIARVELRSQCGSAGWQAFNRQVELPVGTRRARFAMAMEKTYGSVQLDDLAATPVEGPARPRSDIARILLGSEAVGQLFLPEAPVRITVEAEAVRPLPASRLQVQAVVRDYWGAEQGPPIIATLAKAEFRDFRRVYSVTLDLGTALEVGRYYELHIAIPGGQGVTDREFCGFARLPLAATKAYPPGRIPFTIRNWDNRMKEYFRLADRIGIRQLGIWGDWQDKPPYKPKAPCIDVCEELGATWLTTTPAKFVERDGFTRYSEEALSQGMRNFCQEFAGKGLQAICIGNEAPLDPARVDEKVVAYKAIYEAVKAVDPKITVLATSIPPDENFFKAGFQKYCDAYDFHAYGSYTGVREEMQRYYEMMKRFGAVKPLHSTELGLNSQGMPRDVVAATLIQDLTTFFANGGATCSWFTMMYPDRKGNQRGTFGNAHNVFDAQYMRYSPRLDAIAYYHMVNGICVKRFIASRSWDNGVQAHLFRDDEGRCLVVLWRDGDRIDLRLPLPGIASAELRRIDGGSTVLVPEDGAVSIGVSSEPVLLTYAQRDGGLPEALAQPALILPPALPAVLKGRSAGFTVAGPALDPSRLRIQAPPGWRIETAAAGPDAVRCEVHAPEATEAREGRLIFQRLAGAGVAGEVAVGIPVSSPLQLETRPFPAANGQPAGVVLRLRNQGSEPMRVSWTAEIAACHQMKGGSYDLAVREPVKAFLAGEPSGGTPLVPGAEREVRLELRDIDPLTIYRLRVVLEDDLGHRVDRERLVAGINSVPHAAVAPAIDGSLDDPAWSVAPALAFARPEQFYLLPKRSHAWKGADDLSGDLRLCWDESNLYLAVRVHDDVFHAVKRDGDLWNQDGLQFLIDPLRGASTRGGKYDYAVGAGGVGPQAWRFLSATPSVATGTCPSLRVAVGQPDPGRGDRNYEIAIPWGDLQPFAPVRGANLGLSMIINEDDGAGRMGFMAWFSGVHLKEMDMVGDLVLE